MTKLTEPDYEFWDSVNKFDEMQVVCLWAGFEPSDEALKSPKAKVIQMRLEQARQQDRLHVELERRCINEKFDYQLWYWRQDMKKYAELNDETPAFLFPEMRIAPEASPGENVSKLKKREQQIQVIEQYANELGFKRLAIPDGGKKQLKEKCKVNRPELFGGGDSPFLEAWKIAVIGDRIKLLNHDKYSTKVVKK